MKYFLWIFLLAAASAQIVPGPTGTGGGSCEGTTNNSCNIPTTAIGTIHAGDTVIAGYVSAIANADPGISGCGQTWPAVQRFSATNFARGIWIIPHAVAATNCQITFGPTNTNWNAWWRSFSNATSVGPLITNDNTQTQVSPAPMAGVPVTATSAGNLIVGMFFMAGTGVGTTSPFSGAGGWTFTGGSGGSSGITRAMVMVHRSASSAGEQMIPNAQTSTTNVTYRSASIELVAAATNRIAQSTDAMQTVLMNASRNINYQLPAAGLSSTWCTWFMPIGDSSHTYELQPETSRQVNGATTNIRIPSWQMTRICEDNNGNYWASPPLLAGTGISITPSPSGLTIAASGTSGTSGMTYINGGVAAIPGTVSVDPDSCATILNTAPATGVQQSDVVSWSMQPSGSGWANGRIILRPEASAGSIAWRACNSGTTAYIPSARNINWYVARPTQ